MASAWGPDSNECQRTLRVHVSGPRRREGDTSVTRGTPVAELPQAPCTAAVYTKGKPQIQKHKGIRTKIVVSRKACHNTAATEVMSHILEQFSEQKKIEVFGAAVRVSAVFGAGARTWFYYVT